MGTENGAKPVTQEQKSEIETAWDRVAENFLFLGASAWNCGVGILVAKTGMMVADVFAVRGETVPFTAPLLIAVGALVSVSGCAGIYHYSSQIKEKLKAIPAPSNG